MNEPPLATHLSATALVAPPDHPGPDAIAHLQSEISNGPSLLRGIVCAIHPGPLSAPPHLRVSPPSAFPPVLSLPSSVHINLQYRAYKPTFSNRTGSVLKSKTVRFEIRCNHQPTNWMPKKVISNRSAKKSFSGPIWSDLKSLSPPEKVVQPTRFQ